MLSLLVLAGQAGPLAQVLKGSDRTRLRVLLAAALALAALRWFNTAPLQGVMLHLTGASLATLVLGPRPALAVMAFASLSGTLMGAAWHGWGMDFLVTGALPVAVTAAASRAARRWLPHNIFVYIMNKKYNHVDTWIIRDAEEVEGNEDSWFDDDESVLTDLNEEFANMDEETWEEMNERMGDYPFPHRLGLLFTAAAIVDGEFSEEEQEVAIEHIGNALELFGYDDLDPEGVFEYASEVIDENENILNETVELFGEYLSGEALATILQQMREIAGADELDEEESDFIDTVESAWMGGDDDDDEDEEECECDDDEESECDEDEEDEDLDEYETFTVTLGGPNSDEPSYLSICDQEAYSEDDDDDCLENVEIVFTGTKFVTASKAKNDIVSENENEAEIETLKKGCDYSFVTSTGYEGRIIVEDGEMDGKDAEIEVTVYYCESDD